MTILDHREMLIDKPRMLAYQRAIKRAVKKGMVILDLGCGSGIMGFMALEAQAEKVYAIEQSEVIEQAKTLSLKNGFENRFIAYKGLSTEIELPEKVDLIIVENLTTFGAGAEEMQLSDIEDACNRFLKPGGKIIPETVDHLVVPVCDEKNWQHFVGCFEKDYYGLDFSSIRKLASLKAYKTRTNPEGFLADPLCWLTVNHLDYSTHVKSEHFEGQKVRFKIRQKQKCHGLACWFDCTLSEDIKLDNSPLSEETHWKNYYLPVETPFEVLKGDELEVETGLRTTGREADFFWFIEHFRNGKKLAGYNSPGFYAQTISREEIARISGNFTPLKNSRDKALEILLSHVDNYTPAIKIARIAHEQNPEIFESREAALTMLVETWRRRSFKV